MLGSSWKLGGAVKHLTDSSEKRVCRLSFEFLSLPVIEKHSKKSTCEVGSQYLVLLLFSRVKAKVMIRQKKKTKEMKVCSKDFGSELNCYLFVKLM